MTTNNQIKLIETKLRIYNKPFIEADFLEKILNKFAPKYKPYQISAKGLISVVKNGELYKNNLYTGYISRYVIIALYMKGIDYMIGGLFVYNQYGFSTQLPNRWTVYNTVYSGQREIAGVKIIFRRVRPSFFRGKQKKQTQGVQYCIMSRERALIQLLIDTKGNPEFKEDIFYQIKKGDIDTEQVLNLAKIHLNKPQQLFITLFLTGLHK